jgi:hypothetical protein
MQEHDGILYTAKDRCPPSTSQWGQWLKNPGFFLSFFSTGVLVGVPFVSWSATVSRDAANVWRRGKALADEVQAYLFSPALTKLKNSLSSAKMQMFSGIPK